MSRISHTAQFATSSRKLPGRVPDHGFRDFKPCPSRFPHLCAGNPADCYKMSSYAPGSGTHRDKYSAHSLGKRSYIPGMGIHLLKYSTHRVGKTSHLLIKEVQLPGLKIRRLGKETYFLGMPAHLLKMRILVRKMALKSAEWSPRNLQRALSQTKWTSRRTECAPVSSISTLRNSRSTPSRSRKASNRAECPLRRTK